MTMTRRKRPRQTYTQWLAGKIASDLITSGSGTRAERLVLMDASGRDLGGWAFGPLCDVIRRRLEDHDAE